MKNFPFKLLILCILLPPIGYILTIQGLETYLQRHESGRVQQILIKNNEALYEGRHTLKEEIYRNIGTYLDNNFKYRLGFRINILVKTKDDRILYPAQFRDSAGGQKAFYSLQGETTILDYVEVASENFRILNEGLVPTVNVHLNRNGLLANGILLFYVFLSFLFLRHLIKRRIREAKERERIQEELVDEYSEQLNAAKSRLNEIESKESQYLKKIAGLHADKNGLSRDMDELMEEMEKLEAGLESQRNLREEMEVEVLRLKGELEKLRGKLSGSKKRKKADFTSKRFKVLYKNLAFSDRAVEGFNSLVDEFQLKAEEIIHQLNEDESLVTVKRKVFGKGGKMNVLETDFSYSGRIYFQKDSHPKIKIVSIGTKNTQEQDLAYLENLK